MASGSGGFIEGTSSGAIALFNVSDSTIRSVDIDQGSTGVLYNDVTGAHYLEGCSIADFTSDARGLEFTVLDQASFDITSRGNTLTKLDGIFLSGERDSSGDFRSLNDTINNTGTIGLGTARVSVDFGSFIPTTTSSVANVLIGDGEFIAGGAGPEVDLNLTGSGIVNATLTNTSMTNALVHREGRT